MRSQFKTLVAAVALVALAACDETPLNRSESADPQDSKPAAKAAESKPAADPALAAIDKFIADKKVDVKSDGWRTRVPKPDKVTSWDPKKSYFWNLETNKGTMKFKFYADGAPMHVTSFAYLTKLGYYDGLAFHRVINNFMAQGGCPLGTGTGSPGYRYEHENSKYRHDKRGQLSTANAGPNTDGSQFFITFLATPHLDGKHALFGEIVEGSDVLAKFEAAGSPTGRTKEPLSITKATVTVE